MKSKLTIQINNLAALERLIGGDTEVEIELRGAIVQDFAKRHLKAIANEPVVEQALNAVKNEMLHRIGVEVGQAICTFKQTWNGSVTNINLNPSVVAEINNTVHRLVDKTIADSVEKAMEGRTIEVIEGIVEQRVKYYTESIINERIKRKIEKLKGQL